jgi:WD40 repeat protein
MGIISSARRQGMTQTNLKSENKYVWRVFWEECERYISHIEQLTTRLHLYPIENITMASIISTNHTILNIVSLDEENEFIAVGNDRSQITIWDLRTNLEHKPDKKDTFQKSVWCVNPLNQKNLLISTSWDDCTFSIVNYISGEKIASISMRNKICGGHRNLVPFGNHYVIIGVVTNEVQIIGYNVEKSRGELITSLTGHTGWVLCVELLPGGRLASGSRDQTVMIWDVATGQAIETLRGHKDSIVSLSLVDRDHLASGSFDSNIQLWNLHDKTNTLLQGHRSGVQQICALGNSFFASAGDDGEIRIWSILRKYCVRVLQDNQGPYSALVLLPHVGKLVSGSQSGHITIWNIGIPSIIDGVMRTKLLAAIAHRQSFCDIDILM